MEIETPKLVDINSNQKEEFLHALFIKTSWTGIFDKNNIFTQIPRRWKIDLYINQH